MFDDVDLNCIFFAKTPGTLVILYKTSVLNGNKLWREKSERNLKQIFTNGWIFIVGKCFERLVGEICLHL